MRRSNWIIQTIRLNTGNRGAATTTAGISDDQMLGYLNDANRWIYQELERMNAHPFMDEAFINVVSGQKQYDMPEHAYLDSNVDAVYYSRSGVQSEFRKLNLITPSERITGNQLGNPSNYYIRDNQIYLDPTPQSAAPNGLRVNFSKRVPTIDKRRAVISDLDDNMTDITEITIAIDDFATYFPGETEFSSSRILVDDYFCIVDYAGNILVSGLPIVSIDEDDGVLTLDATAAAIPVGTIEVGNYIVAGTYASSHPFLPEEVEPYLIHWVMAKVFETDGNFQEAQAEWSRFGALSSTVLSAWSKIFDDVQRVPIINHYNT